MWKADHDPTCPLPRFYTKYHDYAEDCAEDELDNPASLSDLGVSGIFCSSCQAPAEWEEERIIHGKWGPGAVWEPGPPVKN